MISPAAKLLLAAGAVASLAGAGAGAAAAQSTAGGPFSLGLGVGTNGPVVEGGFRLNDQLVLRGQGAFLDFGYGFKSNDVRYAGRIHFNTGGGFVDWHPLASPWLITAGAVSGQRKVDVSAKPSLPGVITIHGVTYPVTEVGSVVGSIDYGAAAPVIGIGWDNTFYTRRGWGLRALAGVEFGDHPPATALHAIGPLATNPAVISGVQAEQTSLRRQAADFSYFPVVQLGVNYRF